MDQPTKEKYKDRLEILSKLFQPLFTVAIFVFGVGKLYADVQTVKTKVDRTEVLEIRVAELTQSLGTMNENQKALSRNVEKLSDSTNALAINVARLQGIQEKHK